MAQKKNTSRTTKAARTTKKAAPARRTTTKRAEVASSSVTKKAAPATSEPKRSAGMPKIRPLYVGLVLGVLLLAGLLYLLRSFFIAAMVNGQPVSRFAVISELEKQSGKQALNTLVTKTLILQEAQKQNVSVNQDEVNAEMKKIEDNVKKQGQTLDQVLALQGMDRKALEDQIRIQKIVEKILGKDIKVTDKEVQDYIDKNKEALGENPESAESKASVKQQLTQQKLSEKFQTWLADLQKKAKIDYFVNY